MILYYAVMARHRHDRVLGDMEEGITGQSEVLWDRRMPVKLKGKVYKTVVRPPLFYGALIWATTRGQEARLEVNEVRMLRWMCGVTRTDQIQNDHMRGTIRVVHASKTITEHRLKWYGKVRRMKEEHTVRRMLDVDIPVKRRRRRPNLGWKDACKRDMTQAGLKEDNATITGQNGGRS